MYPPRLEAIPVKPIFLDVAWNYIDYLEKIAAGGDKNQQQQQRTEEVQEEQTQEEEKPKKRGWFGFGR